MILLRSYRTLTAGLACWLIAFSMSASAQFFRPSPTVPVQRQRMTRPSRLISRQPPPIVNRDVEGLINPNNARAIVSLSKQRIYLLAGDEVYIDSPISSGKRAGMTPTGNFTITEKDADHRSNIYGDFVDSRGRVVRSGISTKVDSAPAGTRYLGAPMRYFCRLTSGGVGFHTGILPGYPASHGCIRLPAEIAPIIFRNVKIGTPVRIES